MPLATRAVETAASFSSWELGALVAGFLLLFRVVHDYLIYPRLVSEGLKMHPLLVILAIVCGAELGGAIGIFLSIPLAALLLVGWEHWRDLPSATASGKGEEETP